MASSSNPSAAPDRSLWIDGRFVPWAEATVHVLSHSHQRGSLVFDYMSVHETKQGAAVFRLDDHLARFFTSVELVGLPLERDAKELRAAILETVAVNPGAKAVKISAYLASVEVDVVPVDAHVTVAIAAYDPKADVQARKAQPSAPPPRAVRIWLEKQRRLRRPDILHPHAKVAGNYTSPSGRRAAAATTRCCWWTRRASWPKAPPPTSSWWTATARSAPRPRTRCSWA